ncbi:MAG TPA: hypothetical protein VGD81_01100 [Opitutaceae bacterium]
MISRLCFLPLFLSLAGALPAMSVLAAPLEGTWKIDLTRGSELSPWKAYELTIVVKGDTVTIERQLGWGRRQFRDRMTIDTTRAENVVPVEMWPDNRHIGAYIGGDKTKRVRATWLDGRRILRLSSDLMLDTQQGSRAVNILSDYKVSANGAQLTLTELRSTRNRPVVHVFTRAAAPASNSP